MEPWQCSGGRAAREDPQQAGRTVYVARGLPAALIGMWREQAGATFGSFGSTASNSMPPAIGNPQTDTVIFGFDAAWSDKSPGAICALGFDAEGAATFDAPRAVCFKGALEYIKAHRQPYARTVVALDQPTIVPNRKASRSGERVAASLLGFTGGGAQPANRSKESMFGDGAPIWDFKDELGADDDPAAARCAVNGRYLLEVFPALALPGLVAGFRTTAGRAEVQPEEQREISSGRLDRGGWERGCRCQIARSGRSW